MLESELLNAEVDQHVTAALSALRRCFTAVSTAGQPEVISIARQLAAIRGQLARPPSPKPALRVGGAGAESDEERIDRQDRESADRIDVMLSGLCLSTVERRFSQELGERIVELVSDVYVEASGRDERYDPACIAAAVTVALMTVCDPPVSDPPAAADRFGPPGTPGGYQN